MINWHAIDTVFLDMDGTLLDLHFDNYFWLSHLPRRYAEEKNIAPEHAHQTLKEIIDREQGTLNWYCLDYWTETLQLNIRELKEEVQHLIAFRPHVEAFLQQLQNSHHQVLLVTNAHHKSLNLKLSITGLDRFVDDIVCSHDYGHPKEEQAFWHGLQKTHPFDPERTLMIDDSIPVLKSAERYGIKHLLTILQPDSKNDPRDGLEFSAVDQFKQIMPDSNPKAKGV